MFYTNRIFLSLKMLVISFLPLLQFPRTPDHFCPLQVIVHSSSVRLHLTVRLSPTLFFHDPLGSGGSAHPITARRQQNRAFKIFFIFFTEQLSSEHHTTFVIVCCATYFFVFFKLILQEGFPFRLLLWPVGKR